MAKYTNADTSTSFYDAVTGLKIAADQIIEVENPGLKTQKAIKEGRLVEVRESAKPVKAATKK